MKKAFTIIISVLLIAILSLSYVSLFPVIAVTKTTNVSTSMFDASEGITIKRSEGGIRAVYDRGTPGWARIYTNDVYDTRKDGTELEIKDFACLDDDYSVAVMLSNESKKLQDTKGILLVYGYSGYFAIVAMDGVVYDPTISKVLAHDNREQLGDTFKVNIKLSGTQYIITVNGKEYSVGSSYMTDADGIFYSIGIYGDGDIAGLNFLRSFDNTSFSYTVSKLTNPYVGETVERYGEEITPFSYGMHATQTMKLLSSDRGIQFIWCNNSEGWERCGFNGAFPVGGDGLHLKLKDIQGDDNYSIAVRLGATSNGWCDAPGYLISYGKNGNFSIVPADGKLVDMNKLPELVNEKREPLGEYMDIIVRLKDGMFIVTVNGKDYSFKPSAPYLTDIANVYLTFGVFCDGNIKTLNVFKNFKKKEFSYVLDKSIFEMPEMNVRSIKPLASTQAFLKGGKDKFRPADSLTRGEAIAAIASLITDTGDLKGVYSCDYSDIRTSDKNYHIYAYMQRCGFLPDFGDKLEPDKAITLSELIDLVVTVDDIPTEKINISDVGKDDPLYNKVCYAVNTGMIALENNSFGGKAAVSRGQAAEILCKYLKIPDNTEVIKNQFKDVDSKSPYYKYILLAANKTAVTEKKHIAESKEDIQKYIDEAIELSKTAAVNAIIELSDKTYKFDSSVVIDGARYESSNLKITICNKEESSPVISANADIKASEFKKAENREYYSYQLPDTSKVDGAFPETRDLYLNGEMLTMARSDELMFVKDIGESSENKNNIWYIDKKALKDIDADNVSTLELSIDVEWQYKCYLVDKILNKDFSDELSSLSVIDECWHAYTYFEGTKRDFTDWSYYLQNHIALLDEPGEFFYDRSSGIIYVYPYLDTDMKSAVISYPLTDKLFDLQSASGIEFKGLNFTGTTSVFANEHGFNGNLGGCHNWNDAVDKARGEGSFFNGKNNTLKDFEEQPIACGAVYGIDCDYISVKNCSFDELGTHGVRFNGGDRNISVKGCSFKDISMSAISMGTHSNWNYELGQTNILMDNNYIYNIGTEYTNSPAVSIGKVYNFAFTHNTMIHVPYSGLTTGWVGFPSTSINIMNTEVAYNRCEDIINEANDAGGLYFGGANAMTTDTAIYNRIHDNYIKSTGYSKTYTGIYIDMNGSNFKVYNNVITGYSTMLGPVFIQDHIAEQYTHNLIIENNYSTLKPISTNATPDRNIKMENNKHYMTAAELPEAAEKIISLTGQQDSYSDVIINNETEVEMSVDEPHITMPKLGDSEKNNVVFTIKNNSSSEADYSLSCDNLPEGLIDVKYTAEKITLKAGESGEIGVCFTAGESAAKNRVLDFYVKKDNGWKMKFARVIELTVSNAIVVNSVGGLSWMLYAAAVAFVIIIISVITVIIIKRKKRTLE